MVAVRSTRRYEFAEKFWMLSAKILLLPTMVLTLSGVLITVAKRPIDSTVPLTPPAVTASPTLNGRRKIRKAPAAKLASRPPQATPMATPPAARSAANVVVSTPKNPRRATISATFNTRRGRDLP